MPQEKKNVPGAALFDWLEPLIWAFVVVILCFTFLVRTALVQGASMQDTLFEGDRVLITRLFYQPEPGDVVVISPSLSARYDINLIKRVIATEGQEVDIDFQGGRVYVDGRLLDEPYIAEPTYKSSDVQFPVVVPPGCVFVMGDNRNHSSDSRTSIIGMVDVNYILGRGLFRLFPLKDFERI